MKAVTATLIAWLPDWSRHGPKEIADGSAIESLHYSNTDMSKQNWTRAGEATITFSPVDARALIDNKVESLRNKAAGIRAAAYKESMEVDEQIRNLLAISYEPEEVVNES